MFKFKGKYRIKKTDSKTGKLLWVSPWIENLILKGANTGINLFIKRLGNNTTYNDIITSA